MKNLAIALLVILSALPGYTQIADKKGQDIVNKLAEQTRSYQSIKIDFVYKMENTKQNINEKLDGTVWMKGEKYKIHLLGQIIICDGKTVWTINEEAKEVQISSVDPKDEESSPAKLLTNYDKNYRPKFIKEAIEDGKTIQTLDLTPIKGKSFYKIRIRIDKNLNQVVSSTVYDKDQTTYFYIVKKFDVAQKLTDAQFTFEKSKYPAYEIIDMR
jgi:outer membrane lipoprotein-sorting protein